MTVYSHGTRVSRPPHKSGWYRAALALVSILVVISLLFLFVFDLRPVVGTSMAGTLAEGEWVLVSKLTYSLRKPRYGELVVCHPTGVPHAWVKRVVGLPGDILRADTGVLYVNDNPVREPYITAPTPDFTPIKAWAGEYLVFGDNRSDSLDSRLSTIGAIPLEQISGHAVLVIWPPSCWRLLFS